MDLATVTPSIYIVVNTKTNHSNRRYAPLVILGPPYGCSMMTFRPIGSQTSKATHGTYKTPFGPNVTLTAFASTSTPANILARPSLENLTSLCAYRRATRVAEELPTTRRAALLEDWERWCILEGGDSCKWTGNKKTGRSYTSLGSLGYKSHPHSAHSRSRDVQTLPRDGGNADENRNGHTSIRFIGYLGPH